MSLNWLEKINNSVTFYLLLTNQLITKIDEKLTLNVHNTSVPIRRYSSYTLWFKGGEVFMENSATSKVIGEKIIQFRSHDDGCISTLQGVHHVPESRYNLISLWALHREGYSFSSKGDLMKVFKEAHVKFQAERVGNVYMLRNSKVTVGGLQLSSAQKWRLWNNQRLRWFWARMFSCTLKRDWD